MEMSAEWLQRFHLGHCDGHIIVDWPDVELSPTRPLSAVREVPILEVDRRGWQWRDSAVSLRTQKA